MKRSFFILMFIVSAISAGAQDFIGLTERNIKQIMSEENPRLILDNNVKNDAFRYLKYYSQDKDETWIIFIDEKGKCNGVRITCDNRFLYDRRKELSALYRSGEKDQWSYRSRGNEISVRLEDETWFFTITYRKTQQKGKSGNDRAA